jgi:hypothetical protein
MTAKKHNGRSVIAALPAEARETLDVWLFDQNLSYAEIARRGLKNWNVTFCRTTLRRYYHRGVQSRALERISRSARCANAVMKQFEDHPADTYQLVLKMAGQIAFEKAIESENGVDTRTLGELIKILITARKEDLGIKKLQLERDKWEFDAARACRQHMSEIQAITKDNYLDEDAQVLAIRRRLFGANLPV